MAASGQQAKNSGSFWHQFDLSKCQVHWGNAAVCLNVHFDGLFVYFLHFAPKTSKRTIDDLYDAAFESLMMFSHTIILFLYGPRGPGFGNGASIISETLPHRGRHFPARQTGIQ